MKILLLAFAIVCIYTAFSLSGTVDEIAHHIQHGYIMTKYGDLKIDPSHPPLSRYLIGLPLTSFDLNIPNWREVSRSELTQYFWTNNEHIILQFSRFMITLISVLLGFFLFKWTKELYGKGRALLATFLFITCPVIIAHSSLATTDMVAATFIFLSIMMFWRFINNYSWENAVIFGLILGLAQMSKYTALFLYPVFLLWALKKPLVWMSFIVSIIVLWAGYGFEFCPMLYNAVRPEEKLMMLSHYINPELLKIPIPLSTHIVGILGVIHHGMKGHGTFFLGSWSPHGNIWHYVITLLIKTPLPLLILFIAGCRKFKKTEWYIMSFIVMFFVIASLSNIQLGVRYILMIYPLMCIIASRARLKKRIVYILVLWSLVIVITSFPNYLSYYNELIGGSKEGYKYLRDSDTDWGQSLPELSHKLKGEKVSLEVFGEDDPAYYGINYELFSEEEYLAPKDKLYAVSVQRMNNRHPSHNVKWCKYAEPTDIVGNCILIYDFRTKGE